MPDADPYPPRRVVERVEGFSDGDVPCRRCGKVLTLHWNGGELDYVACCGLVYRTEHVRTDLVIEEASPPAS